MFKRFWWVLLVMPPAGMIVGLMGMAVFTYVTPRQYESEVVIEIRPVTSPIKDEAATPQNAPQYYFATEFNKITSRGSLSQVVKNLELTQKWGVDEDAAIQILKKIVTTGNIRGTDLVFIRVRHTDREGVRDIAADLARIYRDYRMEILKRDAVRRLAELDNAVKDQEEKVEERRKVLATIARTGSFLGGKNMTEADVKKAMDGLRAQDLIDAKRDLETDEALLRSLKLKQVSETVAGQIHGDSVVIHDEPQIPDVPVAPNVTLNLLLGAAGGFILSTLLALPVMALLNRLNPLKPSQIVHAALQR